MTDFYREDVAYIHDVGHADFALRSAPGILEILRENGVTEGLVVDLGCGSGQWARELLWAGYRVLGIDISEAMIGLAREKAPGAEFRTLGRRRLRDALPAAGRALGTEAGADR